MGGRVAPVMQKTGGYREPALVRCLFAASLGAVDDGL